MRTQLLLTLLFLTLNTHSLKLKKIKRQLRKAKSYLTHKNNLRVIGGNDVQDESEAKWFVRLYSCMTKLSGCSACGGTWISSSEILTAAHCIKGNFNYFWVNHDNENEAAKGTVFGTVLEIKIHEDWNGDADRGFDIAILKTNQNWDWTVDLADQNDFDNLVEGQSKFIVYGFGWTDSSGSSPSPMILQKSISLNFWRCTQAWFNERENAWYDFSIGSNGKRDFSKTICFDGSKGSDMCPGDSGGPLIIDDSENNKAKQYGINSYIFGTCGSMPSVDTSVAHYLDWIELHSDFVRKGSCQNMNCSQACFIDEDEEPKCACGEGYFLDGKENCVKIDQRYILKDANWSLSMVREDNTIRPFRENLCFYHKMNGFTENELIFMGECRDHDRYKWSFDNSTGLIENFNRRWIVPHCITIPDHSNSRQKQALTLQKCLNSI